jgi:predicted ester cyclase
MNHADKNRTGELARNVAVAFRFKKSQGTKEMPTVEKEVLAPHYDRVRGGNFHLASNARDQGWPGPGMYLRTAFPDRVDVIEEVIAEGDRVGLLFRVTATHTGEFFGIPPSGKRVDVYEIALLRIADGQMVEGWFMMDEVELLRQVGAQLPTRSDGRIVAPAIPDTGEDGDAFLQGLLSRPPVSLQDRHKVIAARSRSSKRAKDDQAADYAVRRHDFQHLQDYANAHGTGEKTPGSAFPDRRYKVDVLIAEGDQVWMKFQFHGTHQASLCGLQPTGKRVGVPAVAIMRFVDGKWKTSWNFGDELGLLLQLGQPNLLLG